ncbi:hypothetical protein ACFFJX_24220 [Pseudarcicella hirudinis]|uniref:hypothetical protein n=1 Tax=Pseudarcicella hirudinis TaxID=1079859 RepID=UPI0035EDD5B6
MSRCSKPEKKGVKGQGGVSEELAKLAREQGQLRKMLQQFLDNNKGTEKKGSNWVIRLKIWSKKDGRNGNRPRKQAD